MQFTFGPGSCASITKPAPRYELEKRGISQTPSASCLSALGILDDKPTLPGFCGADVKMQLRQGFRRVVAPASVRQKYGD